MERSSQEGVANMGKSFPICAGCGNVKVIPLTSSRRKFLKNKVVHYCEPPFIPSGLATCVLQTV